MKNHELLILRVLLASIWLYNGLYLKLILVDPEHLAVVQAVGNVGPITPAQFLFLIGVGETVLGLVVLSGFRYKNACQVQAALIIAMNAIGIVSGGVTEPAALIFTNLPLLFCLWVAYRYGAGQ